MSKMNKYNAHVIGIIRLISVGNAVVNKPKGYKYSQIIKAITKALDTTIATTVCDEENCIKYTIHPDNNGEEYPENWGNIAIYGDLHDLDREGMQKIESWFLECLDKLQKHDDVFKLKYSNEKEIEYLLSVFIIQDAFLSIDVEGAPKSVLVSNKGKIERLECK